MLPALGTASGARPAADRWPAELAEPAAPEELAGPVEFPVKTTRAIVYPPPARMTTAAAAAARRSERGDVPRGRRPARRPGPACPGPACPGPVGPGTSMSGTSRPWTGVPGRGVPSRARFGRSGDLRGQGRIEPGGQRGGHGRGGGAGQDRRHRGELGIQLGAAWARGQVGGDPGGLAGGQQILTERSHGLTADVAPHRLSPPPSAGETSPAAVRFRVACPGPVAGGGIGAIPAACATAGDPRRWASGATSRARPRAQRLFTVPAEMPSTSAASATG